MINLNLFQWIALLAIFVLLLADFRKALGGRVIRRLWALRVLVWLAAAIAILQPQEVTRLAQAVGIERGADLVLYLSVLAFIGVLFYLYTRYLRLQQQITQIVRHIAIQEAQDLRGNDGQYGEGGG